MSLNAGQAEEIGKTDEPGKKMGMWLFLYTEIILFGFVRVF